MTNQITYKLKSLVFLLAIALLSCEKPIDVEEYGSLSGTVKDAHGNIPLQFATITTDPASTSIQTDENGSFLINNVSVGEVTVTVKKLNYKTSSITVKVYQDQTTDVEIVLEKSNGYGDVAGNFIDPVPANGELNFNINDTIKWKFISDVETDSITYDLNIFQSTSTEAFQTFKNLKQNYAITENLEFNATYFWQVAAVNNEDSIIAFSEVWSFNTTDFPDNPIIFARNDSSNYDIFSSDTLGQNLFKITGDQSNIDWYPRMNPITNRIAFVSNRNMLKEIYLMDLLGSNIQQVTTLEITGNYNQGTGFCWSPDGSAILYPHYDKLYRINSDGTGLKLIATAPPGSNFTSCDWSKYTNKIVVQTTGTNPYNNEIYLMNEDGSNIQLFVEDLPGIVQNPVFSLDGQMVMFTHDEGGLDAWDGRQLDARIYLKAINDTVMTDISFNKIEGTNDLMPRFSPDGSKIIFVNTSNVLGSKHNIYTTDFSGKKRKMIIENGTMPEWRKTLLISLKKKQS